MTLIERRPRQLPKLVGKVWPNLQRGGAAGQRDGAQRHRLATGQQRFYPGIGPHLRALYAAVAAGEEPPVSAAEGRDVVAWYDEILAQSGHRSRAAAPGGVSA